MKMRTLPLLILIISSFLSSPNLKAQVIADFETSASSPMLSPTGVVVANNPDQTGINVSSKVAFFQKPAANWQALYLDFAETKNAGDTDRLVFKLYTSTVGRVFVKIVNNGTTILENWAPTYGFMPQANVWTECSLDLSSISGMDFDRIEVNASVDNEAAAMVYVDDFKLYNTLSPNGEPIIELALSASKVAVGTEITFDASGSEDLDGSIVDFEWKFGDGTISNDEIVNKAYTTDGIFEVTLTITDDENKSTSQEFMVYVTPSAGKTSKIKLFTASPRTYDKIEAGFVVVPDYVNPYDPDEVTINALVTLPDLTTLTVPCFYYEKGYYQAVDDQWKKDEMTAFWMVRFSTAQPGTHKIKFEVTDASGTTVSQEETITVTEGTRKGYIRMDPDNHQYYRHTTGEPYYPLGINAAWDNTTNYTTIISNLGAGGANLVRYWQVPFDRQGLEWTDGFYDGLGVYSQEAAAEQDSIMALCEAHNVMLQTVLFQHGMFSENVNSNWPDNPYNTANGGMLTKAEQFFYNVEAKAQTKKLLRYIIARWGYSPSLFAWELFNEVQFTGVHPSQTAQWATGVVSWHDEMGQYIKVLDPFDHIVTTSASDSQIETMRDLEGLDNLQYHLYNPNLLASQINTDNTLNAKLHSKGLINGEYGLDVTTADVPFETQRIAIWTGIFTEVPHLMWLWENYRQTSWTNLFTLPSQFLADKDLVAESPIIKLDVPAKFGTESIGSLALATTESLHIFVFDSKTRASLSNVKVDFTTLPKGSYNITYTKITDGTTTTQSVDVTDASPFVTLPAFSKGLVVSTPLVDPIVTGVEESRLLKQIKLFPNPTNDEVSFEINEFLSREVVLDIYNPAGVKVASQIRTLKTGEPVTLSLRNLNLKSGLYSVKLTSGESTVTKRFVYVEK